LMTDRHTEARDGTGDCDGPARVGDQRGEAVESRAGRAARRWRVSWWGTSTSRVVWPSGMGSRGLPEGKGGCQAPSLTTEPSPTHGLCRHC
jgi:hypothetical protein